LKILPTSSTSCLVLKIPKTVGPFPLIEVPTALKESGTFSKTSIIRYSSLATIKKSLVDVAILITPYFSQLSFFRLTREPKK